jgi:acyl-coenzyme A synthetase/AMP-(fatty) acid ligase
VNVSIDDRGQAPPCPRPFNLAAYVLEAGRAEPDKTALLRIGDGVTERWTFGEIRSAVTGLAGHLSSCGLAPGEKLLLRLGNDPVFPIAFLAAAAADLVPVVVSSLLTEPELAAAAAHVKPGLVIADTSLPLCPFDCAVLTADDLPAAMAHDQIAPVPGDPDRPGYVVFTSGTAARPRAVLHAHRAVWARRMMWQGWYGLGPEDRLLHAGAFNWTFTLGTGLLDPWAAGATAIVPAKGLPAERLPDLLRDSGATIFAAAPGIYRKVLDRSGAFDAPSLRHGLSAGEKLSDRLRTRWAQATGCPVHEAFGMSECSTFVSGSPSAPAPEGTLGRAQPGRRVAVLDDAAQPAPRGTTGHLAVAADDPGLMLGYLGPDGTLDKPLQNDWFVTGDIATMLPSGALVYGGRDDDMLNAGGVRVSPLEVEAALAEHPEIRECAAAEVHVKADVSVIAAFCVSANRLDDAALNAHMSARLARYKLPRLYVRVDSLPRNANGKLKRRALRDAWEADNDQA